MKALCRMLSLVAAGFVLVGCSPVLPEASKLESPGAVLDLRAWNFLSGGPVVPQSWAWDADVLWTPKDGRPAELDQSLVLGPPDRGGTLIQSLERRSHTSGVARATFRLEVLVSDRTNYGLQIGAMPGHVVVWVNGVSVWDSPSGAGTVIAVQPRQARLELVVNVESSDFLVKHPELNRLWILGPAQPMLAAERAERMNRSFQAMFLLLGALLFSGVRLLRSGPGTLAPFIYFLAACLAKLVVNVEQTEPFLEPFFPLLSPSLYLGLNHALNLLPFPFMMLFLHRQFPQEFSRRSLLVIWGATAVTTVWELLPFAALAFGFVDGYETIMRLPWSMFINLYVVLVVLYMFERFFQTWTRKRPLSGALFLGGIFIGLIILLPILLSYFIPTKFTFFLGWGMIVFLSILGYELIRIQVLAWNLEVGQLQTQLADRANQARFLPHGLAPRLRNHSSESPRPGDRRKVEAVLVQVSSPDPSETWLPTVGKLCEDHQAMLAQWRERSGIWLLESWPEAGLALALDLRKKLGTLPGLRYRIVLARVPVELRVLEAGATWISAVDGLPQARLQELDALCKLHGATIVLDSQLKDGLVIGGWHRHRHLTPSGHEIEFYEGESESSAQLKDSTLDAFESALARAHEGHLREAVEGMLAVVRQNPFDETARTLLSEWNSRIS